MAAARRFLPSSTCCLSFNSSACLACCSVMSWSRRACTEARFSDMTWPPTWLSILDTIESSSSLLTFLAGGALVKESDPVGGRSKRDFRLREDVESSPSFPISNPAKPAPSPPAPYPLSSSISTAPAPYPPSRPPGGVAPSPPSSESGVGVEVEVEDLAWCWCWCCCCLVAEAAPRASSWRAASPSCPGACSRACRVGSSGPRSGWEWPASGPGAGPAWWVWGAPAP
mmetsp:Transcript_7883/g.12034  ORF Transcript_7883/g.12034 Transcript_7883/m.12034 type:complete len:227 (+) Transcript_7883:75-755(+)